MRPALTVDVVRSGFVESRHQVSVIMLNPDGTVDGSWGGQTGPTFARSALKPLQTTAMIRSGLRLDAPEMALAGASHDGSPTHIAGVQKILASAQHTPRALRCPPALPSGEADAEAYLRAGGHADPLHHECSGKHAAMVATCARSGWPVDTYLSPDHPLQAAIRTLVEELTAETITASGVDGCGAPTHAVSLEALARAYSHLAAAPPESVDGRAAAAMRAHPELVGGDGRDITEAMRANPGLVAKDGAEAIYALALPDGRAAAFKVHDGGLRAAPPVMFAILRRWGVAGDVVQPWAEPPILGHGRPVGSVRLSGDWS